MRRRSGFTLIELLVVIAIVALLVSLLLPGLGKARKAALLARSMSNMRQINIGGRTYQEDHKSKMPLTLCYQRGTVNDPPRSGSLEGWCTWNFGGKNNSPRWAGMAFDVEAADRPLNPYVFPELTFDAPAPPARMLANDPARALLQLDVFRDPGDKIGHQFNWPNENSDGATCYDDCGTSYQFNTKWWCQIYALQGCWGPVSSFERAFAQGTQRLALADSFQPARFVWAHDETADIVANQTNRNFQLKNGYDDINKSVMAFMDGHGAYHRVRPGGRTVLEAFSNADYTFVFEDLRLIP